MAIIAGIIIGIGADWLGRFVLPIFAGIISCTELFFRRLAGSLGSKEKRKMQESGMSSIEIEQAMETFREMDHFFGMGKARLYTMQFIWTYISTLIVAIIIGLIKQFT